MKKTLTITALLFCFVGTVAMAQESHENSNVTTTTYTETTTTVTTKKAKAEENIPTVSHTVQMGETVMLICKKYVVAPDDIYKLNPEAIDGLTQGMVLRVPADKKVDAARARKKPADSSVTSFTAKKADE